MTKKRIGIIEDDKGFSKSLCELLATRDECEVVFVADSYQSSLACMKAKRFDILLVDLGLPDGDGADLILRARRAYPHAESYVLSVTDDGALIVNAFKHGAKGFVFKSDPPFVFLQQINNIFFGGVSFSGTVSQAIINELNKCSTARALITDSELQVVKFMSIGFRPKEISERLNVTINTINTHIKNVYRKLDVNSSAEAINVLQL